MGLTRAVLAPEETLAPFEETWQLALADRPGAVSRQISSGTMKNVSKEPSTVVAMTAEFQVVAATPAAATLTG